MTHRVELARDGLVDDGARDAVDLREDGQLSGVFGSHKLRVPRTSDLSTWTAALTVMTVSDLEASSLPIPPRVYQRRYPVRSSARGSQTT